MRNQIPIVLTFLAVSTLLACGNDASSSDKGKNPAGDATAHSHEGAHGGGLVELGTAAHLEFVRKEATGEVTLYVTGPDGKSPLAIVDAPEIKLATAAGQKVLTTTPSNPVDGKASEFTAKDDALKAHQIGGRVSITVGGKLFNPQIVADHDHDHDHDHK
jgi:hypothetical protein